MLDKANVPKFNKVHIIYGSLLSIPQAIPSLLFILHNINQDYGSGATKSWFSDYHALGSVYEVLRNLSGDD